MSYFCSYADRPLLLLWNMHRIVPGGSGPKCLAPILYQKLANVKREYESAFGLMAHVSIHEKLLQVCQLILLSLKAMHAHVNILLYAKCFYVRACTASCFNILFAFCLVVKISHTKNIKIRANHLRPEVVTCQLKRPY